MSKLVFQHVYMGAIEHGHNVKPDDIADAGFSINDTASMDDDYGSGSGGYLPFDPFPRPSTSKACYGAACFRPTALIGCGLSVVAVVCAITLVCRTSSHYGKLYSPTFQGGSSVPHRQNYTRELAAQREYDYRREQAARELQQRY